MPPYPYDVAYCSMHGEDIKNDLQAWEAAEYLRGIKQVKMVTIIRTIYNEAENVFDMTEFPDTDKGTFSPGPLLRIERAVPPKDVLVLPPDKLLQGSS